MFCVQVNEGNRICKVIRHLQLVTIYASPSLMIAHRTFGGGETDLGSNSSSFSGPSMASRLSYVCVWDT